MPSAASAHLPDRDTEEITTMPILAQYVWIDGTTPTAQLRGKTKVLTNPELPPSEAFDKIEDIPIDAFPVWGADGSSTNQATGEDSDIILQPVRVARDPFRDGGYLVLCEAFDGQERVQLGGHAGPGRGSGLRRRPRRPRLPLAHPLGAPPDQ